VGSTGPDVDTLVITHPSAGKVKINGSTIQFTNSGDTGQIAYSHTNILIGASAIGGTQGQLLSITQGTPTLKWVSHPTANTLTIPDNGIPESGAYSGPIDVIARGGMWLIGGTGTVMISKSTDMGNTGANKLLILDNLPGTPDCASGWFLNIKNGNKNGKSIVIDSTTDNKTGFPITLVGGTGDRGNGEMCVITALPGVVLAGGGPPPSAMYTAY
jgi:hypothetical protein